MLRGSVVLFCFNISTGLWKSLTDRPQVHIIPSFELILCLPLSRNKSREFNTSRSFSVARAIEFCSQCKSTGSCNNTKASAACIWNANEVKQRSSVSCDALMSVLLSNCSPLAVSDSFIPTWNMWFLTVCRYWLNQQWQRNLLYSLDFSSVNIPLPSRFTCFPQRARIHELFTSAFYQPPKHDNDLSVFDDPVASTDS